MKTYKLGDIISLRDIGTIIGANALVLFMVGWLPIIPMFFLLNWIGLDFEINLCLSALVSGIVTLTGTTIVQVGDKLEKYEIVEKDVTMK